MASSKQSMKPADWAANLPRPAYAHLEKLESPDEWFSLYRFSPDTYIIYEDGQYEEAVTYLLLGAESAVLVDSGNGIGNIKKLCRALTDLPIKLVNTHSHIDHIGSNYLFDDISAYDDENGMARRRAAVGYGHDVAKTYIGDPVVIRPYPGYFDPETFCVPPYRVTRWLKDGDIIDLGGRRLEVLHTPGHSPDSLCLLDGKSRLLFNGDIFYTGSIYTWLFGGDINLLISTYHKLIDRISEFDLLMPAHNEPTIDKGVLYEVLSAAESIAEGTVEPVILDNGRKKYRFGRFAFVTR